LPHDLRPLDPRSAGFARHLPLRIALRASRLALWVEDRIGELAGISAVADWGYAVEAGDSQQKPA
jgi:hypothetical protein